MTSEICAVILLTYLMQLFGENHGNTITQSYRFSPYPKYIMGIRLQISIRWSYSGGSFSSNGDQRTGIRRNNHSKDYLWQERGGTMKVISIDTIQIRFHVPMQDIVFDGWKHKITEKVENSECNYSNDFYFRKYTTANGTVIHLQYLPKDFYHQGENFLFIETSLPRLLYGCNHKVLEDWDTALDQANIEFSRISGLPKLDDIRNAIICRLDVCINFQVGENGPDYIQALQKGYFPHRSIRPYPTTGIIFCAKSGISTCIYLKYEDPHCGHEEARGLLRFEISMRKKNQIDKRTGKKNTLVRDITLAFVTVLLSKDLKVLKLDHPMVCDRFEIEQILSNKYSPRRVRSLLGYWLERQTMTQAQMRAKGISRRIICHYEKLLGEANLSSLSTDSKKILPPLSINSADDKICNKVVSDTRESFSQIGGPLCLQ